MAKEKQQELPQSVEVTRLAVSISRVDGKYVIEDLHVSGDEVVKAEVLVSKPSLRVASGEMLLNLEERLGHWQQQGLLK